MMWNPSVNAIWLRAGAELRGERVRTLLTRVAVVGSDGARRSSIEPRRLDHLRFRGRRSVA